MQKSESGAHWGVVRITRGPYAGTLGLYDDDGEKRGSAVVYPGPYPDGGSIEVNESDLEDASETESETWWAEHGKKELPR